jgi:S1-C subfamily serine protease
MSETTLRICVLSAVMLALIQAPSGAAERTAERSQEPAWLGVWLTDALDGGVEVVAVVPQGPAQRAGLLAGDLILEADARAIADQDSLGAVLSNRRPGEDLQISLLRSGVSVKIAVTLGRRSPDVQRFVPEAVSPVQPVPPISTAPTNRLQSVWSDLLYGLRVAEITPALREHYGAPPDRGVLVLAVGNGEANAFAHLEVGDVLVRVGEQGIRSRRQLERTLSTWRWQRPLEASIVRAGEPLVITIAQPASMAPTDSPPREREILEKRIRLEIERLRRRLQELEAQLEALGSSD